MFTDNISDTLILTSDAASTALGHIGVPYLVDCSFTATLRALLYSRIPEGRSIEGEGYHSRYSESDIRGTSARDLVRVFLNGFNGRTRKDIIVFHEFRGSVGADACLAIVNTGVREYCGESYKELADVGKFLEQTAKWKVKIFISEEYRNVLIFSREMCERQWHLLQSVIPRLLPWYFKDKPLSKEETRLLASLILKTPDAYLELIEKIGARFDFEGDFVRKSLVGFESVFEEEKLTSVRDAIDSANDNIEQLERRFSELYKKLEELHIEELGLMETIRRAKNGEGENTFMKYFLGNKSLHLLRARGGNIKFVVTTIIANFDPEVAERAIDNPKSFFYKHYETGKPYKDSTLTDEQIKRLMTAVFLDETLKLRVCAAYRLDFKEGYCRGIANHRFTPQVLESCTPNQHIQHYACLGNNIQMILKAIMNHDYCGAVTMCCASAANINLNEANTGSYFMEEILKPAVGRIMELPDGTTMTPLEAVQWLEAQETKEE